MYGWQYSNKKAAHTFAWAASYLSVKDVDQSKWINPPSPTLRLAWQVAFEQRAVVA